MMTFVSHGHDHRSGGGGGGGFFLACEDFERRLAHSILKKLTGSSQTLVQCSLLPETVSPYR